MHAKNRKPACAVPNHQQELDEDDQATAAEQQMRHDDYAAYGEEVDDEDSNYEEGGRADSGDGYYSDGAYVAKPLPTATGVGNDESSLPQDVYYDRLKELFAQHRSRCRISPSADAVAALDDKHPISFPHGSQLATHEWRNLILTTSPLPAQLCSMDRWTVWRLLRLCERHIRAFALRTHNIPAVLARWIWGLLGRLDESWQMRNEEVSKIRELGKCAVFCLARYQANRGRKDDGQQPGPESDEGWDYDEDYGIEANVDDNALTDEVQDAEHQVQAELKDATGGAKHDSSAAAHTVPAIPPPDGVSEDGELDTDTRTKDDSNKDVSDMFAARKRQLQHEAQQSTLVAETPLVVDTTSEFEATLMDTSSDVTHEPAISVPVATVGTKKQEVNEVPNAQTSAVLELIITITGEFYGQRDLLWSRQKWQADED